MAGTQLAQLGAKGEHDPTICSRVAAAGPPPGRWGFLGSNHDRVSWAAWANGDMALGPRDRGDGGAAVYRTALSISVTHQRCQSLGDAEAAAGVPTAHPPICEYWTLADGIMRATPAESESWVLTSAKTANAQTERRPTRRWTRGGERRQYGGGTCGTV